MTYARNLSALAVIPLAIWFGLFVLHATAPTMALAAVAALAAVVLATPSWAKNAFLAVFSTFFAIGLAEGVLRVSGASDDVSEKWGQGRQNYLSEKIFIEDDVLGFDSIPNASAHAVSRHNGKLIYDAVYSIDAYGARTTPPGRVGKRPVVLMGDSFHFGEGLNDDQTLGYYLQSKSMGELFAVNLARPAYGPHQTLRQIELDQPGKAGVPAFDWLLISVIDDHIERANGRYWWSRGPRYVPDGTGHVRQNGLFEPPEHRPAWLSRINAGSRLYVAVRRAWLQWSFSHDQQVFAAILRTMRETVARKYGAKILVIYHPGSSFLNDQVGRRDVMHRLFTEAGVEFIDVNHAVPNLSEGHFIAGDGHPSEKLNAAIADVVLRRITQAQPSRPTQLQSLHQ